MNPGEPLLAACHAVSELCGALATPYAIIGGIAASLTGRPRFTRDVDALLVLPDAEWTSWIAAATDRGFVARVPDAPEFLRDTRVWPTIHQPSGVPVDFVMAGLPFEEEAVRGAVSRDLGGIAMRIVRAEGLCVMKVIAGRPRDVADVQGILDAVTDLDVTSVRRTLQEFDAALGRSDFLSLFDQLVAASRGPSDA